MRQCLSTAASLAIAWPLLTIAREPQAWTFESEIIVCVTASGEPWREIDRGVLKRRETPGRRTDYLLIAGGQSFRWREGDDPGAAGRGPRLSHYVEKYGDAPTKEFAFPPDPMRGTEKPSYWAGEISVKPSGEVREKLGPFQLATFIASECPSK